jgi:hypothetical protein
MDIRIDSPADKQARIVFTSDGVDAWEIYRQPDGEFGIYNERTGRIVLKFSPDARPVVSGSWADGSAARSVLAALVLLGLVEDTTTD